jgi:hypothetical protein
MLNDQDPRPRAPLAVNSGNRNFTLDKDSNLFNAYVEIVGDDPYVYKRPGIGNRWSAANASGCAGMFNWNGDVYYVAGTALCVNGALASVTRGSVALDTSAPYTFSITLGSTPRLFLQNATAAYYYEPNAGGLLAAVATSTTVSQTGTITHNSAVITGIGSTASLAVGASLSGAWFNTTGTIQSVDSGTQVTMTEPITITEVVDFSGTTNLTGANSIQLGLVNPSPASVPIGSIMTVDGFPGYTFSVTAVTATTITGFNSGFPGAAAGFVTVAHVIYSPITETLTFVNRGMPSDGFVPGNEYLDGVTYVLTPTGYVRGSNYNDVTIWENLNSIAAMSEPDSGVRLAKQLTYILAMKRYSIEVFQDAGNPTGSALSAVPGMKTPIGCANAYSVASVEDHLFWWGQTKAGEFGFYRMQNMQSVKISSESVDKILAYNPNGVALSARAFALRMNGHLIYVCYVAHTGYTFMWDNTSRNWGFLTSASTGTYFKYFFAAVDSLQQVVLGNSSNCVIDKFDQTLYADYNSAGSNYQDITVDIVTPIWDGGTKKKKALPLMDIVGDAQNGGLLLIRKTDDDYQTWSNFRVVDLAKQRPHLTHCGTFRRRAWHLRHASNAPLRLRFLELGVDLGTL